MTEQESDVTKPKGERPRVRLYPTDWFHPGIRSVERLVPAELADQLLAVPHPAFTTTRPEGQDEPTDNVLEDVSDIEAHLHELTSPPAAPAASEEGPTNG